MLFLTTLDEQGKPNTEPVFFIPFFDQCRRCGDGVKVLHEEDIYCRRCLKEMIA
jgi:hypothetical protein